MLDLLAFVDHVDTLDKGNKKSRQINGLVNEWYLEDLSENIRRTFDSKKKTRIAYWFFCMLWL